MDRQPTLHDKYLNIGQALGGFGEIPTHITDNLAHQLRPYQVEAIGRYMFYQDRDQQNKSLPVQLLFNMATGSGKTLVMAALMLDAFKRGRRNFIFFVNSTTIIDKTRVNFLDSGAPKYLFADRIIIDGQPVTIREVANFNESRDDAINIVFTTIQGLHSDLNNPRENRLTYDEIGDYDIVLLSDEAHHLNASTKNDKEAVLTATWERTLENIMAANRQNILLEFTATIDMSDANIWQKYNQRILYQYDLKAFRKDGFSKDVLIYEVDSDLVDRALQAIIISQYRKKVALAAGVWCKPVVMFKSARKADSENFYLQFIDTMASLNAGDIDKQRAKAAGILTQAFVYFESVVMTSEDIVTELKADFVRERLILIDSDHKAAENQILLNTLEARSNEIRAVFSVDMLDEGWDVLNLFDIVRLYDKRDSSAGRPGKTTLREAQLIGRGARYFPFSLDGERKFTRKFDGNELEPLRAIEQLHYHSAHNPKYIQEISQALKESGIVPDEMIERELKLKDSFKKSRTYTHGVVWQNTRLTREEAQKIKQTRLIQDGYDLPSEVFVTLPSGSGQEIAIFETADAGDRVVNEQMTKRIKMNDLPKNVIRTAIARNKKFTFGHIERAFFGVESLVDFMYGKSLLGGIEVEVTGNVEDLRNLSADHRLYIASEVLRAVEESLDQSDQAYVGSDEFEAVSIREIFGDVRRKFVVSESADKETGYPQYESHRYGLNLAERDWYAYNENYGTNEEKSLVVTLDGLMDELRQKWSDVYLIRNEKAVRLYDFDTGQAFEPDYLLLANDKQQGNRNWQLFIEPKGGQFLDSEGGFTKSKEGWKQVLLSQIAEKFDAQTLAETKKFRVIGVPFYNEANTKDQFIDTLRSISSEK